MSWIQWIGNWPTGLMAFNCSENFIIYSTFTMKKKQSIGGR